MNKNKSKSKRVIIDNPKQVIAKKFSKDLRAKITEKYPDYCPVEALIAISFDPESDNNLRFKCHSEVAKYVYPKIGKLPPDKENQPSIKISWAGFSDISRGYENQKVIENKEG